MAILKLIKAIKKRTIGKFIITRKNLILDDPYSHNNAILNSYYNNLLFFFNFILP